MRLDQCCEIVAGATPSTSESEYWGGDICWATPKDLSDLTETYIHDTPRKLTESGLNSCAATVLPPRSVLFSSRAPIGHVAINTVPMATNQGFKSFVPKDDLVHPEFLFHWLRFNRVYLESLGNGATFKEVSKGVISRVEINLPPVDEQRRIAAILDQAETLRTQRRTALALLDSLTHSLFLGMFGEQTTFPRQPLDQVCELITDGTHYTPTYVETGVPFLSAKNVTSGYIDWESIKHIPESLHQELQRRVAPQKGDVLMAKNGTTGVAAIVDRDCIFDIYVSLALLRPSKDIDGVFLHAALNSPLSKKQFNAALKGIGVPNLHLKDIRGTKIPVPPLPLQQTFATRIASIEALKATHRRALAALDALFASLQHRAFAGQL